MSRVVNHHPILLAIMTTNTWAQVLRLIAHAPIPIWNGHNRHRCQFITINRCHSLVQVALVHRRLDFGKWILVLKNLHFSSIEMNVRMFELNVIDFFCLNSIKIAPKNLKNPIIPLSFRTSQNSGNSPPNAESPPIEVGGPISLATSPISMTMSSRANSILTNTNGVTANSIFNSFAET